MSANYQSRAEAEASMLLAKLAGDMEHGRFCMPVLLGHDKAAAHHAEERGAAACVKQWSENLKP